MSFFNRDLKISSGEKHDTSRVSEDGIDIEKLAKNNKN